MWSLGSNFKIKENMAKYLDSNGITTLWNKIKNTFPTREGGGQLVHGTLTLTEEPTT